MRGFSQFSPVTFSPDSKRLAYAVKENRKKESNSFKDYPLSGVSANALGADIFVTEVVTGAETNLTGGMGNSWLPAWSPDGRYLAFLSDRDGSGQAKLWIWEAVSGKLRKVSDLFARANQVQWLPNNRQVVLTALPASFTAEQFAQRVLGPPTEETSSGREDKVPGSTVVLYQSAAPSQQNSSNGATDGAWSLDGWLRDLVVVDVESGKAQVLEKGHRVATFEASPEGSNVAFTIPKRFEKAGSQQILFDLGVVSLKDEHPQIVASEIRLPYDGSSFRWSPDSSRLVYQSSGLDGTGDCYVVELRGGPPKNISSLQQSARVSILPPPLWDAEGQSVFFIHDNTIWKASPEHDTARRLVQIPHHRLIELVARQGVLFSPEGEQSLVVLTYDEESKQCAFYSVTRETGESAELIQRSQSFFSFQRRDNVSISPDGKAAAFFVEDAEHPQDLWVGDPSFRDARRLTHINSQLDKYHFGSARPIAWRSLDGDDLHGALLLPAGYEQGKRYPLIVCVYGGRTALDSLTQFGFSCAPMNLQLFATRGYAVLFPDAPQHLGTPMLDLAKTVLPGVDKVIELGIADPAQLGLMGHSYGGYSVLALLVQTRRFKAAMAADGYGDLAAAYGQLDKNGSTYNVNLAENGQMQMGGPPWQFPARFMENSPVFHLDRVETPLLLVHGAEDNAVASFLAGEVFVGLRRLGKKVTYAKYEGESHDPAYWSYPNELDFCTRVIAWFDGHLKQEDSKH